MNGDKIIGLEEVRFTAPDGKETQGKNFYTSHAIVNDRGSGEAAQKVFLSDSKLNALKFKPQIGDEVMFLFNRYGKAVSMQLLATAEDNLIIE